MDNGKYTSKMMVNKKKIKKYTMMNETNTKVAPQSFGCELLLLEMLILINYNQKK